MSASSVIDLAARAVRLLGRTAADGELREFLEAVDAWPPPPLDPNEVSASYIDKDRGFELTFQDAAIVEHASAKGLPPRTPILVTIFFYASGQDGNLAFEGPLPGGITWTDRSASLIDKLGAPTHTIHNKKTGALKAYTWPLGDATLTTTFNKDGELTRVDCGI